MRRVLIGLILIIGFLPAAPALADSPSTLQPPTLKWKKGGCHPYWCETGWYSSPAVTDLDGDGSVEVVAAGNSVFALDAATGALEWRVAAGKDRSSVYQYNGWKTHPGIVVADVDDDGEQEIVTSHDGGYISVYTTDGYFEPGWPQRPTTFELFGLAVQDLDHDRQMEIITTAAVYEHVNTWVFEPDGTVREGWPQWPEGENYAYGTFMDNLAVGDMDLDGTPEIVVPSDINNVPAYHPDGQQQAANEDVFGVSIWGHVNTFESYIPEQRGWAGCSYADTRAERYIANFDNGSPVIVDVDGDGTIETVVSGNIYDCPGPRRPTLFHTIYIFNQDRTRYANSPYDWTTPLQDVGSPLSENFDVIRDIRPAVVVADLDGDGDKEILMPSFDGKLHAFWLDKTEHGSWPHSVYDSQEGVIRFAAEPAVADLNDDGKAEVLFTSWPEPHGGLVGKFHILDYMGNTLFEVDLPPSWIDEDPDNWNGGLAAPTLADIDGDSELEALVNTATSGVVAYDLPGTASARILWGTGRWNYQRTASSPNGTLASSTLDAHPRTVRSGDIITYTIRLENPNLTLPTVTFTDAVPAGMAVVGAPHASSGLVDQVDAAGGGGGTTLVTWSGSVVSGVPVIVTFTGRADVPAGQSTALVNTLLLDDGLGNLLQRQVTVLANGARLHIPIIQHLAE